MRGLIILGVLGFVSLGLGQTGPPPGWDSPPPGWGQTHNPPPVYDPYYTTKSERKVKGEIHVYFNGTKPGTRKGEIDSTSRYLSLLVKKKYEKGYTGFFTSKHNTPDKLMWTRYKSEVNRVGSDIKPNETDSVIVNGFVGKPNKAKAHWQFETNNLNLNYWMKKESVQLSESQTVESSVVLRLNPTLKRWSEVDTLKKVFLRTPRYFAEYPFNKYVNQSKILSTSPEEYSEEDSIKLMQIAFLSETVYKNLHRHLNPTQVDTLLGRDSLNSVGNAAKSILYAELRLRRDALQHFDLLKQYTDSNDYLVVFTEARISELMMDYVAAQKLYMSIRRLSTPGSMYNFSQAKVKSLKKLVKTQLKEEAMRK